jgi:hypothetical protein
VKKLLFVAWWILAVSAHAGSVAFLADGKHVVRAEGRELRVRGLQDPVETVVPVPAELKGEQLQLARHRDGEIVVAGDRQAMEWNPVSKEWKPLCEAPAALVFDDVACDPKSGNLVFALVSKEWDRSWRVLPAGQHTLKDVFNRRSDRASFPVFDVNGFLYFSREGDIWRGELQEDKELSRFVFEGERVWPLAGLVASIGASGSTGTGAEEIAPMTTHLLVHRKRLGGTGWGTLVRIPNGNAYEAKLPLSWEALWDTGGRGISFAITPDGQGAAIYVDNAKRWFMLEKPDGELVQLPSSQEKADH